MAFFLFPFLPIVICKTIYGIELSLLSGMFNAGVQFIMN